MAMLKRLFIVLISLFLCLLFIILAVKSRNIQLTQQYLKQFTPLPDLNTFAQVQPKIFLGNKKLPEAVLLLHGWSATPEEFTELTTQLKKAGIPYYAPLQTGFGLADFHLLQNIKGSDWRRDAIQAYDVLAALAEEVSVIGHSNGGVLAIFVAEHRPVKHLILLAPYLFTAEADIKYKTALNTSIISQVLQFCLPVFKKPARALDNQRPTHLDFRYPTMPINSLISLWKLQDSIDIGKANFQDLTILYGKQDDDVNMQQVIDYLRQRQIPFDAVKYEHSAHNILQDQEKRKVIAEIQKKLLF